MNNSLHLETQITCPTLFDHQELQAAIAQAIAAGHVHYFSSTPRAWKARGVFYFDVAVTDRISWINSAGREVVVFLLTAPGCKGYSASVFEPP